MIDNLDLNQIIFILTIMISSAVLVGFMAGFFGIGGGLIMVPVLFYLFDYVGIEKEILIHNGEKIKLSKTFLKIKKKVSM